MAAADPQRRELNDNVASQESPGAAGNGAPVPLFMDADGGLCGLPVYLGAMWPDLEGVELDLPEPYPSHVWVIPAAVTALNELIDDGLVQPISCTSWDGTANVLISTLGLHGGPWPVAALGTRRGGLMRDGIWIKTEAVSRLIRDQRFVMVDDLLGSPGDRPMTAPRRSLETTFGTGNMLLIGTRPERGLTAEHVARIREYVRRS
jgi:hypothetical protein